MSLRKQRKAFQDVIERYLEQLSDLSQDEDASNELSLRPALDTFIEGFSTAFDRDDMSVIPEPIRQSYGTPDYKLKTDKGFLIGYIEAKGLTKELDDLPERDAEQVERYRDAGKRFMLTNHRDFWLYDYASDGRTVMLQDKVTLLSKSDVEQGRQPKETDVDALHRLLDRFLRDARPDVNTPEQLAERLAAAARHLCDELRKAYDAEGESGHLHGLMQAFEEILIPDIGRDQFTDMYAQTLSYGLFAAAVNHQGPELLNLDNAWRDIPKTNKFLRRLFESVTGSALEDKSYKWIIEDLLDVFNSLDMLAILEGFGRRPAGQDPVVHFYEDFLAAYDPKLRERLGVYYTPEPVVSYIVRSVDHLLTERFGCPEGLADRQQVTYTAKRNDDEEKQESHKVLVLDPACGTGTFLYFVIDHIRQRFIERGEPGMWSDYVRHHLLPRIFGFELLMASYAMAHLKLGMQLAGLDLPSGERSAWTYDFEDDERLSIYLTNTLEEPILRERPLGWESRVLTDEANAAVKVKRELPILVVTGNPPYSGISSNMNDWINNLLKGQSTEEYGDVSYYTVDGQPLGERKVWLQDDYVKFIRWAQWRIEQTGSGILAFISNHGYLDNPTFRGMREKLLQTFDDIYVLDLHGNTKKGEQVPEDVQQEFGIDDRDQNVFDIQQGVAIGIFIKDGSRNGDMAQVHHQELWGLRDRKYQWLNSHTLDTNDNSDTSSVLSPNSPYYFFVPLQEDSRQEYEVGWHIPKIMPRYVAGIATARDHFVFDYDQDELINRITEFADPRIPDETIRNKYFKGKGSSKYPDGDTRGWKLPEARRRVQNDSARNKRIVQCLYRPFDIRPLYYADWMVDWPRPEVMKELLAGNNLALITSRLTKGEAFKHIQVTRNIVEVICMSPKTSNNGFVFPLYRYPTSDELVEKNNKGVARSRISEEYRKAIVKEGGDNDEQNRVIHLIQELYPESHYPRFPNLHPDLIQDLREKLELSYVTDGRGDLDENFGPEDVFHYIYAILHSPTYRKRYKEFLKIDFPRVPLTSNLDLFRALCQKGADLVALHLMEADYDAASWNQDEDIANPFQDIHVRYPVRGEDVVEKGHPKYAAPGAKVKGEDDSIPEGRVYISESKPTKGRQGQYFGGVPPEVWEFQVGGYQVCEKWLKDRKGRKLSYDDREHYKRIVMALGETIRLMSEIDEAIDEHGGWPIE